MVRAFAKEEKGQSLVELALSLPVFLLVLVGIINLGMIFFVYLNLNIDVQETARVAGLGYTDAEIAQFAHDHVNVKDPASLQITIVPDETTRKSGDYVTVTFSYPMNAIAPVFDQFLSPFTLKTISTVRVE